MVRMVPTWREQFIQGLCDPRMQKHVAKREPKSLPEALSIARQFEETESWIQTAHRPSRRIARVGHKPDDRVDKDDDHEMNNNNDKQVAKITSVTGKQNAGGDTEAALMLM